MLREKFYYQIKSLNLIPSLPRQAAFSPSSPRQSLPTTASVSFGGISIFFAINTLTVFSGVIIVPALFVVMNVFLVHDINLPDASIGSLEIFLQDLSALGARVEHILHRLSDVLDSITIEHPQYDDLYKMYDQARDISSTIDGLVTKTEDELATRRQ